MGLQPENITNRPAVVLAIDGGGIRGIIPAMILENIRQALGCAIHEAFDLISGTSTGGIVAVGMGTGANNGQPYTPGEMVQLYVDHGPEIFKSGIFSLVSRLWRPKYPASGIEQTLQKFFGATMLSSARTALLISSYDLQGQLPFFFKSHRIPDDPSYDWPVWQVARATSAAPTYFPAFHLLRDQPKADYALVDGGIAVNDPAVSAYAEARKVYPNAKGYVVVSIGCGDRADNITYQQCKSWGLLQWATKITTVILDSVEEATDYELRNMTGRELTYFRLQISPMVGPSPDMDNVTAKNLQALKDCAQAYIDANAANLQAVVKAIQLARGWAAKAAGKPN
jgi:patatin-like phospholipase/acyl hydrolase